MAYAALSTRNRSGLHPNLRGLGAAADTLTPADAMQQAISSFQGKNLNPKDFQNSAWLSTAESQVAAGQFNVSWYSPACAGNTAPPLNLFSTASGLALSTAGVGTGIAAATGAIAATTATALGAATMGAGLIVAVIAMIFQHHAAAVKRDLAFGCSALPAVNNAFSLIYSAVQNGQTTPDAAASSLDQIFSNFMSAGGAAINYSPFCNSNCEMAVIVKAMVLYWQAQYKAMAAASTASSTQQTDATAAQIAQLTQQADAADAAGDTTTATALRSQAATLAAQSPASTSSIPSWLWFVAAAAAAWAVM